MVCYLSCAAVVAENRFRVLEVELCRVPKWVEHVVTFGYMSKSPQHIAPCKEGSYEPLCPLSAWFGGLRRFNPRP